MQYTYVSGIGDQYIVYDPDTGVMYIIIRGTYAATMSVLYNADGTPKLYNPEEEKTE